MIYFHTQSSDYSSNALPEVIQVCPCLCNDCRHKKFMFTSPRQVIKRDKIEEFVQSKLMLFSSKEFQGTRFDSFPLILHLRM